MGLVLTLIAGLVVWVVLWALGAKAFDAFMITVVMVVILVNTPSIRATPLRTTKRYATSHCQPPSARKSPKNSEYPLTSAIVSFHRLPSPHVYERSGQLRSSWDETTNPIMMRVTATP